MAEPFEIPPLKDSVGWRLSTKDKQNLRLLMMDRREASPTKLLRDLVEQQADPIRQRMIRSAARIAAEEAEASG
jgi:type VI protein secretion system component VasA